MSTKIRIISSAKFFLVLATMMLFLETTLAEEIYLFEEETSLLITNIPSQGYNKKIGSSNMAFQSHPVQTTLENWNKIIEEISKRNAIPSSLTRAIITVESGYNPFAVSPKGAKGLMQLMDGTAKRFGVKDIFDPHENILGGVKYLRYLLDFFGEDLSLALAAYNAGERAVLDHGGIPPYPETMDYVKNVKRLLGFQNPQKKKISGTIIAAKPYIIQTKSGSISIVN
ncbi:MAG: lytic transglycosylase domain-containing protein [Acidobacteriota bacterium]